MTDPKSKMYTTMFNAVTDAIKILQKAQMETEEIFISQEGAQVVELRRVDNPQAQDDPKK